MTPLLLATRNLGKKREIEEFLRSGALAPCAGTLRALRLLSLDDVPAGENIEETGETFAENARLKADHFSRVTGWDTLGDDSGLEVYALGGLPGVRSARYAGEGAGDDARIDKLLDELKGSVDRRARFVSALCLSRAGSPLASFIGTVEGEILREKRGVGGFGYDPLFLYPPLGRTFAELSLEEKNRVSHRARALDHVREFILKGGLK